MVRAEGLGDVIYPCKYHKLQLKHKTQPLKADNNLNKFLFKILNNPVRVDTVVKSKDILLLYLKPLREKS